MGQDLKICKNCVHSVGSESFPLCSKSKSEEVVNLVTGRRSGGEYYHAKTSRDFSDLCGERGRWYEAKVQKPKKPSLLQRIKLWMNR